VTLQVFPQPFVLAAFLLAEPADLHQIGDHIFKDTSRPPKSR
jgi:hypothetical protein